MSQQTDSFAQKTVALTVVYCLLFAPILGCSGESDSAETGPEAVSVEPTVEPVIVSEAAPDLGSLDAAWHLITETTESGLTIVSEKCSAGTEMVLDASKTAWIWSADTTADGWGWIVENAGEAKEWASDGLSRTWTVTKQTTGEFSLWVQVTTKDGVAWSRTALPASWKVVKDSAGDAWIWIDEHKVEVAIAAAVVTVVIAALIIAPEAVGPAVTRSAATSASAEGTKFLAAIWEDRDESEHAQTLQSVSKDMFMNLGKSVITQCGSQIVASIPVPGG